MFKCLLANEAGFKIERALNADFTSAIVIETTGNTTSYNDTGLETDTMYYYRVKLVLSI